MLTSPHPRHVLFPLRKPGEVKGDEMSRRGQREPCWRCPRMRASPVSSTVHILAFPACFQPTRLEPRRSLGFLVSAGLLNKCLPTPDVFQRQNVISNNIKL